MRRWLDRFHRSPIELNVRDAYALWAATYSPEAHNRLMELEQQAMLDLLPEPCARSTLDLACGTGRYLRQLIDRQAARAFGIDLSLEMLARARSISSDLAQADLFALPLASASFDLIVCGLAVGHNVDLKGTIAEMARVLKYDGRLIYSDFHPLGSLLGWKRTFRASDEREYVVEHHPHFYADHHTACRSAGLTIEAIREPRLDFDHPWRGYPAVLVIRAWKEG